MKTVPTLVTTISTPPIAGPTARARFWLTEPSAIACGRSAGATSSGWSVCQVGDVHACPLPSANVSASSTNGVTSPASASAPSAAAAISMNVCATSRKRRRSTRSPTAPAGTANSSTGRLDAVWISVTGTADVVSESISHCAPTVCIQPPTLLTNWAPHISLNRRERNGAQAEPPPGTSVCSDSAGKS